MGETRKTRRSGETRNISTRVHRPPQLRGVAENLYALQQDLEIARKIQGRLLPPVPEVRGYDFAVSYQPAGEVGGDFYDFLPMEDGRLGFLVADASGKGLAGALLMVEARAMIRAMASVASSPREVMLAVNRVLHRDLEKGMFVTVYLAVLDPRGRTMTVTNAGHTPMLVWRAATGEVEPRQPRGLMLGAISESRFGAMIEEETVALEPGDRFLLYSDGVSELMNPVNEEFGMERLGSWLRAAAALPSATALAALTEALETHRAGHVQSDDITILTGRLALVS